MLFTLHRYLFRELFRVFLLAGVGLTLILSLGSILEPVQEFGLGSRQVIHLMGYFLPITLTFVLPMAALFAGALVYGRFASDNEFDACRATGISVVTLVYPGLALAIMVAIANLILSFYVMPVFVHRAEESLKADAKHILFRNIQRKRYYALPPDGRFLIYADRADMGSGMLSGVIVAQMQKDYRGIEGITMAERAKIDFDPNDRLNEVHILAYKPRTMGADLEAKADWMPLTYEFGSLLGDDIKFKKIDEMKMIRANLIRFYPIEKLAVETYRQLIVELLAKDIRGRLSGPASRNESPSAPVEDTRNFYSLLGEPNSVRFAADQCVAREEQIELIGNVVVIDQDTDGDRPARTLTCRTAWLSLDRLAPTLTMDLDRPEVAGQESPKLRHFVPGLLPPQAVESVASNFRSPNGDVRPDRLARELWDLSGLQPGGVLGSQRHTLQREIDKTLIEIKSEIHSRLVFGTGCVPMILIGIGLGIIKKGGHLLTAFGASCIPAAVLIVCIMSGKQMTENLGAGNTLLGVAIMWGGLAFLALVVMVIYGRLLRH